MPVGTITSMERRLGVFRHSAIRLGIYAGVALSVVFVAWIIAANRIPSLEVLATERNVVTAVLLVLCAAAPVIRFVRSPGELLLSGLLAFYAFSDAS